MHTRCALYINTFRIYDTDIVLISHSNIKHSVRSILLHAFAMLAAGLSDIYDAHGHVT